MFILVFGKTRHARKLLLILNIYLLVQALHVPTMSCFPEPGAQPINLFRRLRRQVDIDVLGSDDCDAGTPSRSDGRLVQRRLATRPATPSTPQVCRRDARRDGHPRHRPFATDIATSVSRWTVRTTSTTSASEGGRRINDGNCPPVAHRLSRLGRNEFSDAAGMSAEELRRGVVMPASSCWRQRPVAPVLGRRDAGAGEHDARKWPAVDRSLVDCHHCEPGSWMIALLSGIDPLTMTSMINKLLVLDIKLFTITCFSYPYLS